MSEVSMKKVLRTIKFCNKGDVNKHHPTQAPSPRSNYLANNLRTPKGKVPFIMTDVTHKKVISFADSFQCFPSIKKVQAKDQALPLKMTENCIKNDIQTSTNEKPKASKFMSKKKNLIITEFLQFEDENQENKENNKDVSEEKNKKNNKDGFEEEIKENLVNKHVISIKNTNQCPKTMSSIIRKKNMTPKFAPNFTSKTIFNIPELKLKKVTLEKHFNDFKVSKELQKEKDLKKNAIFRLGEGSNILTCCYDRDDSFVAFGSDDSLIRIYKTLSNKIACCFSDSPNYGVPLTSLKFKPIAIDNILMSCRVNGVVSLWNIEKNQMISSFKEDNYIYTGEYNRDGDHFATAGYDTKIRIYDQNTLKLISILEKDDKNNNNLGHANRIYSLKYCLDHPNILLSGGWDETLFIWDTRVGHNIEYIYGPLICGDSLDVKGNSVLTGSWRNQNQLQVWDLRNKKISINIPWVNLSLEEKNKRNHIYACQFDKYNDRYIIAGTTGDNQIRIFDKNENYQCMDVISGFEKPVYTLNFDYKDQKIAFGSGNGLCGIIEV